MSRSFYLPAVTPPRIIPQVGQIFREDETRFFKIMWPVSSATYVRVKRCDESGKPIPRARSMWARLSRFGSDYQLVRGEA